VKTERILCHAWDGFILLLAIYYTVHYIFSNEPFKPGYGFLFGYIITHVYFSIKETERVYK
jgi:hypothetical protein